MNDAVDTVAEGRAAWQQIKENSRRSWDGWLKVGKAIAFGRAEAMRQSKANRPVGTAYVRVFGAFLRDNGFSDTSNQERYAILKILEHLPAVTAWRDGLPEAQRRRHNHPSLWNTYRNASKAATDTPARPYVRSKSHRPGRPVYFSQDMLRRAAMAIAECGSPDIFRLARVCLEAAIRSENDIAALLETKPTPRPAEAPSVVAAHA
jgi:hypothetical protein